MKRSALLTCLALGLSSVSTAQTDNLPFFSPSVTRAVVVGISNYQNEQIPDLKFAHRDAEAFAAFLRSPAGGKLDEDHIKVLLNEEATAAQFAAALDWLIEETGEDEQAIIYFSGHGDVETKTRSQMGFLLTWDSPHEMYIAGAFPIFYLQEVVSTLSLDNKAKVMLITDACRSGKLAGSEVNGSQLTNVNLMQQFAKEIKILSCQPDEYSIEGLEWGGGRGVFSYHLVEGLLGLADRDHNLEVTLGEIDRYLEDHVTPEVAPVSQVPVTVGLKGEMVAAVDRQMLADLRSNKDEQLQRFSVVENRGLEEEVLAQVDSVTRQQYYAFKEAVAQKHFFEPPGDCADDLYRHLSGQQGLARLHNHMKRNYAAALQDDVQQMFNAFLYATHKTIDPDPEVRVDRYGQSIQQLHVMTSRAGALADRIRRYARYVRQLEVAGELIGENHYMYPALMGRKFYLQAAVEFMSNGYSGEVLPLLEKSREFEPNAAFVYHAFGVYYLEQATLEDKEQGLAFLQKAIELSPKWGLPYYAASVYYQKAGMIELEKEMLQKAVEYNPYSPICQENWGNYCRRNGRLPEAEEALRKVIELDPSYLIAYKNLFQLLLETGRREEAVQLIASFPADDSPEAHFTAGTLHLQLGDLNSAEAQFRQYLQSSRTLNRSQKIGWEWLIHGERELAEQYFQLALEINPHFGGPYLDLAWLYYSFGDYDRALLILTEGMEAFPELLELRGLYALISHFRGFEDEARSQFEAMGMTDVWYCLQLMETGPSARLDETMEKIEEDFPYWWIERFLNYGYLKMLVQERETTQALARLEDLDRLIFNYQLLRADPALQALREAEGFEALLQRHFPGRAKP